MLDLTKPLELAHEHVLRPKQVHPVELAHVVPRGIYVKWGKPPTYWFVDHEGNVEGNSAWKVKNVSVLVTKSMVAVLYKWGEDINIINFIDMAAAYQFFKNQPGKILGWRAIVLKEGDNG